MRPVQQGEAGDCGPQGPRGAGRGPGRGGRRALPGRAQDRPRSRRLPHPPGTGLRAARSHRRRHRGLRGRLPGRTILPQPAGRRQPLRQGWRVGARRGEVSRRRRDLPYLRPRLDGARRRPPPPGQARPGRPVPRDARRPPARQPRGPARSRGGLRQRRRHHQGQRGRPGGPRRRARQRPRPPLPGQLPRRPQAVGRGHRRLPPAAAPRHARRRHGPRRARPAPLRRRLRAPRDRESRRGAQPPRRVPGAPAALPARLPRHGRDPPRPRRDRAGHRRGRARPRGGTRRAGDLERPRLPPPRRRPAAGGGAGLRTGDEAPPGLHGGHLRRRRGPECRRPPRSRHCPV